MGRQDNRHVVRHDPGRLAGTACVLATGVAGGHCAGGHPRRRSTGAGGSRSGSGEGIGGAARPVPAGDPQGPLLWTCSSAARWAEQLGPAGHRVSERAVNRLLHELGYRLQASRNTLKGRRHPDRTGMHDSGASPGGRGRCNAWASRRPRSTRRRRRGATDAAPAAGNGFYRSRLGPLAGTIHQAMDSGVRPPDSQHPPVRAGITDQRKH